MSGRLNSNVYYTIDLLRIPSTDPPVIRLLGAPQVDLEEGKDFLTLRCEADANPRAGIVWRRIGRSDVVGLQETLQLRPVGRRDAGLYTCQGQNSVGSSETLSVQVDVKCKQFRDGKRIEFK